MFKKILVALDNSPTDQAMVAPISQLARLHGSNRAYIEQTIPHISRLMKPSIDSALQDAELIVIGKRSAEYREPLRRFANGHRVIDLASLFAAPTEREAMDYEGICW